MSNQMFLLGRGAILSGSVNVLTDEIRLVGVDAADYTPNLTTHEFLSSVPGGGIVTTSPALTGKSIVGSTLVSSMAETGVLFTSVTGDPFELFLVVKWTGTAATTRLLAKIDTQHDLLGNASSLSVIPNSSDIRVRFAGGELFTI